MAAKTSTDRWKALDFAAPPADAVEPDEPILVEYSSDERVAVITLNRPETLNAWTAAIARSPSAANTSTNPRRRT